METIKTDSSRDYKLPQGARAEREPYNLNPTALELGAISLAARMASYEAEIKALKEKIAELQAECEAEVRYRVVSNGDHDYV